MYRLKTTANFNVGGGGTGGDIVHDSTLIGAGTSDSPLRVNSSKYATAEQGTKADSALQGLSAKQDTLVSGINIKTVNNLSLLGSGNIEIESGGSSYIPQVSNETLAFLSGSNVRVEGKELFF